VSKHIIRKYGIVLFLTVLIIIVISSCNFERACDKPTKFPVQTKFYNSNSSTLRDTVLKDVSLYGVGREDSLIYNDIDTNQLNYRLSPFSETTKIILNAFSKTDTLTYHYLRHIELVSQSCGFAMFFDIKEITFSGSFIDSVHLIDPTLDASKEEHLQVFVH
jgi:hypothetical protein